MAEYEDILKGVLKGQCTRLLLTAMSMEALVTFCNPQRSFTEGKDVHLVPVQWKPMVATC